MKTYLLTLFLTLFVLSVFSQHSSVDLCSIYQHAVKNKNIDSISYLLTLDSTQISAYDKAELLSMRGLLHLSLSKKDINKRKAKNHPAFIEAKRDFTLAIKQNVDKNEKLKYTFRKFVTLEGYKPHYTNYQSDLYLLKSKGFKPDKFGMGISAKSKFDGNFWLGAEFSIVSGYRPSYSLKNYDEQIIIKSKPSFSMSALTVGFTQNIETTSLSDLNFSLLRLEAPLYIDVLQFGFIDNSNRSYWYYRPELGIGYSIFHLSGGYNLFFGSRKGRESLSNAMINFRIKHVF